MLSTRWLAGALLALVSTPASAQCPDWTEEFEPGGLNGVIHQFQVHDWGTGPQLVAGGEFQSAGGDVTGTVARWDGQRWVSFGSPLGGRVIGLAVYDAGNGPRLYAGGTSLIGTSSLVVWDGATWSLVPGFTGGGVGVMAVYDGWLYFAGGPSGAPAPGINRWNGSIVHGFGGVLSGGVFALAVHDEGQGPALFVGGNFLSAGGTPAPSVARWNGSSWSAVGNVPMVYVNALASHDLGAGPELVATGLGSQTTARWDGAQWTAMPGLTPESGTGFGYALLSTGAGPGAELYCGSAEVDFGGVGGSDGAVARWTGSAWGPVASGITSGDAYALARYDDGSGARLFAGGWFFPSDGQPATHAVVQSGSAWVGTGSRTVIETFPHQNGVLAITRHDDGSGAQLYVGGDFQGAGTTGADSLARWDGATWSDIGDADGYVFALCEFDDGSGMRLYAGGQFATIGGATAPGIARWDGTAWAALPGVPLEAPVTVIDLQVFDDGTGPALYAVGSVRVAGMTRGLAARWQNGQWTRVGAPACVTQAQINDLAVHVEGGVASLYGCGFELVSDCTMFRGVVRWDGVAWIPVGTTFTSTQSQGANLIALVSHDDGSGPALVAGGSFTSAGGVQARNIARWQGGAWAPLGAGINSSVSALASYDEGLGRGPGLLVGGNFNFAGSTLATNIALWRAESWSPFGGGIHPLANASGSVQTFYVDAAGPTRSVYVGGHFGRAGDQLAGSIARFEACDETGRTYCYGDGSASACPCANASPVGARAGCQHSLGSGATLRARGEPSLSQDTLSLDGASMPNSAALYFQGASQQSGGQGVPFGDGLKCTVGPFVRLLTKQNASGASTYPEAGDVPISLRGLVVAPGTRHYQVRYRNAAAFCTVDTFNYTNATEIVWSL